jgi:integrase
MTFLITERGAPFTPPGFGNWFRKQCDLAGLAKCSAHGLRKAAATRLADAGCSANQIAAITGHKSLSEVAHYTRAADQERLARQALQLGGVRRT